MKFASLVLSIFSIVILNLGAQNVTPGRMAPSSPWKLETLF